MSERTVQRVGAKVVVRSIDNAGCTMRALTVKSKLRLQGSALAAALAKPDIQSTLADLSWRTGAGRVTGVSVVYGEPKPELIRLREAANGAVAEAEVVWQGADGALDQDLEELMPEGPQRTRLDWKDLGKYAPEVDDPRTAPLPADRATLRRRAGCREGAAICARRSRSTPSRASSSSAARASPSRRSARPSASRRGPSRATSAASRREADDEVGHGQLIPRPWPSFAAPSPKCPRTRTTADARAPGTDMHHRTRPTPCGCKMSRPRTWRRCLTASGSTGQPVCRPPTESSSRPRPARVKPRSPSTTCPPSRSTPRTSTSPPGSHSPITSTAGRPRLPPGPRSGSS